MWCKQDSMYIKSWRFINLFASSVSAAGGLYLDVVTFFRVLKETQFKTEQCIFV